jgi:hypothetical protein
MAMIAITTSSSMSVKPPPGRRLARGCQRWLVWTGAEVERQTALLRVTGGGKSLVSFMPRN